MKWIIFFLLITTPVFSQNNCEQYANNYIPKNLKDAMSFLNCKWSITQKNEFKKIPEDDVAAKCHLGMGRWLRNNWGLWKCESEIYKYFGNLGVSHPEDISSIIILSFHRFLHKKDLRLKEQINFIKQYWKKLKQKELTRKKLELSEFNVQDTVEFSYDYDFISKKQEKAYVAETCNAKGIVLAKDTSNFQLRIKLIESCSDQGVIIQKYDVLRKQGNKWVKKETDKIKVMKTGDIMWTPYNLWETTE